MSKDIDALNLGDGEVSVPVVAFVGDNNVADVIVCSDLKDAVTEEYYRKYSKNQAAESMDLSVRLDVLFPALELFTLFDSKTFKCVGVFRTKDDADRYNKCCHPKTHRQFAVLVVEFQGEPELP